MKFMPYLLIPLLMISCGGPSKEEIQTQAVNYNNDCVRFVGGLATGYQNAASKALKILQGKSTTEDFKQWADDTVKKIEIELERIAKVKRPPVKELHDLHFAYKGFLEWHKDNIGRMKASWAGVLASEKKTVVEKRDRLVKLIEINETEEKRINEKLDKKMKALHRALED